MKKHNTTPVIENGKLYFVCDECAYVRQIDEKGAHKVIHTGNENVLHSGKTENCPSIKASVKAK